jgi:hypothetical protein
MKTVEFISELEQYYNQYTRAVRKDVFDWLQDNVFETDLETFLGLIKEQHDTSSFSVDKAPAPRIDVLSKIYRKNIDYIVQERGIRTKQIEYKEEPYKYADEGTKILGDFLKKLAEDKKINKEKH